MVMYMDWYGDVHGLVGDVHGLVGDVHGLVW